MTSFTVVASTASLNVKTIGLLTETALAPFIGLTLTTVGTVVLATAGRSCRETARKWHYYISGLIRKSTRCQAVGCAHPQQVRGAERQLVPLLLKAHRSWYLYAARRNTTALLPTLAALNGALATKSTRTFAGTLFAPFAGLTISTVGADVFVV